MTEIRTTIGVQRNDLLMAARLEFEKRRRARARYGSRLTRLRPGSSVWRSGRVVSESRVFMQPPASSANQKREYGDVANSGDLPSRADATRGARKKRQARMHACGNTALPVVWSVTGHVQYWYSRFPRIRLATKTGPTEVRHEQAGNHELA